jgi:hypothetical protein
MTEEKQKDVEPAGFKAVGDEKAEEKAADLEA